MPDTRPNIVYILADDMGYGDVGCYNPQSKIPTPYMDRLAREGMRFADAHSPSAVCTPTPEFESYNKFNWEPGIVREFREMVERYIADGRSV